MIFFTAKSGARWGALLGIVCLGVAAAGCGSSSSSTPTSSHSAAAKPSGTANVAYAASLLYLNEKIVAPAFQGATA
jgi:ABC-type molybdate transport system substrate-binding protein